MNGEIGDAGDVPRHRLFDHAVVDARDHELRAVDQVGRADVRRDADHQLGALLARGERDEEQRALHWTPPAPGASVPSIGAGRVVSAYAVAAPPITTSATGTQNDHF